MVSAGLEFIRFYLFQWSGYSILIPDDVKKALPGSLYCNRCSTLKRYPRYLVSFQLFATNMALTTLVVGKKIPVNYTPEITIICLRSLVRLNNYGSESWTLRS